MGGAVPVSPLNVQHDVVDPEKASIDASHDDGKLAADTSAGVRRIEQMVAATFTTGTQVAVYVSVFLIGWAYGMDGLVRSTYQSYATDSYSNHALLSTINVLRSVIAAAAQPTYAKLMDVFGRSEVLIASVFFYVLGTIIESTAHGVQTFAAGAIFYQLGYSGLLVFVTILVSDITSLRNRAFFATISSWPFLINTWISGNLTSAVLKTTTWRWGIGMWGIIVFAMSLPLIVTLWLAGRRAKRIGTMEDVKTPFQRVGGRQLAIDLFWQLDVIGIIFIIAVAALILAPFTIAGGEHSEWKTAHVIAPLVIGFCCVPAFALWEARAPHPLVPFSLLKDRGVWSPFILVILNLTAWYLQGDYLYTTLIVSFNFSVLSATRVASLYSFVSVLGGTLITGVAVRYVRRLKPFVMLGIALNFVAFGILIAYRSGADGSAHGGVIAAQIVLGLAGGFFTYPNEVSIQAQTRHEHMAVITGLYYACYDVGGALGFTLSGAIWTQTMPEQLSKHLTNQTLAATVYDSPLTTAILYPMDSPERQGIITAYRMVQRYLCVTGICLLVPLAFFVFFLRNPLLGDEQSLPQAEGGQAAEEQERGNKVVEPK